MSTWADELIDFWRGHTRFSNNVHPKDVPVFEKYDPAWRQSPETAAAVPDLTSDRFLGCTAERFITSLHPAPFCGDLRNARAVVLLLNPGFHPGDHIAEQWPEYQEALRNTLDQAFEGALREYPLFALDPRFAASPAYSWWAKKFEKLAEAIAAENSLSKTDAYRRISQRVATLELVPYHSRSLGIGAFQRALPSYQAARSAITSLLNDESAGTPQIIITRSVRHWLSEEEQGRARARGWVIYESKQARSASLGPASPGGEALLEICAED
jgi:hypothetical protein